MTNKTNKERQRLRDEASIKLAQTKPDDINNDINLLHELQVHQIELEMQNEQLRQVQGDLEASRDRFVELYEFAPIGYLSINADGMIDSVNLTATTMFGISRKQLIKKTFALLITDHERDFWRRQFNHLLSMKHGDELNFDIRFKHHEDNFFYANIHCLRVDDKYGDSVLRISLINITERKKHEEALRIAATAFETLDGIFITDSVGVIIRVNRAFTNITGYSDKEAIGQTPHLLSSDKQDKSFYVAMWESLKDTDAWQGEIINRHKSGRDYTEHLSITAVKDNDGYVTNYVATFIDITANKTAETKINQLAFYDPLTLLPNRRLFIDRLNHAIKIRERSNQYGAILFLDLDNFKTLNDTLGHTIGDLLLQQVSKRITLCLRISDTAARMGGDEFVILLENLGDNEIEASTAAKEIGEKILKALNDKYTLDNFDYMGSVSIGITLFSFEKKAVDELLKQADIAMYQAKSLGRNTLQFYSPQMQQMINKRAELEQDLLSAIEQQQFELYYQVQVDSKGSALGAECLIRWHHPIRGLVSPIEFIPVAEESEIIVSIGQWVLKSACAQLQKWQKKLSTQHLSLSVNISAKQINQTGFTDEIKQLILQYSIDPKLLNLELTEGILLHDIEDSIAIMNTLKAIGVRFELDDFGTGYSSLQYLKRLPIYRLKIDQSFVEDISTNDSDLTIVRTIIAMAESLELEVIAEGVETEEQKKLLFAKGCTSYQGYLFGRPLPIDEFEALLK